jgi:ribose transport system substrate-binding protein
MQRFFRLKSRAVTAMSLIGVMAVATAVAVVDTSSAAAKTKSGHIKIAYLSFAVNNSYDAPMLAAAKAVAAKNNATLQVFDANNSPTTQYSQFQDAITAGGFSGIITQPIESTNLISLVKKAVAKGIKVVNIDQMLGPKLDTANVQVKGLSGNVTFDPLLMGEDLGALVVQACKADKLKPCDVGYLYDIKASALDVAIRNGFGIATKGKGVNVVSTGQDYFLPADGLTAVQTMVQGNSSINVIAGSDQGIEGADKVSFSHKVALVGYGGSAAGIAGVKSGKWYGTIVQDPASEGRVGMQQLISAIRTGVSYPGTNPLTALPNGGIITKANVTQFKAEWAG